MQFSLTSGVGGSLWLYHLEVGFGVAVVIKRSTVRQRTNARDATTYHALESVNELNVTAPCALLRRIRCSELVIQLPGSNEPINDALLTWRLKAPSFLSILLIDLQFRIPGAHCTISYYIFSAITVGIESGALPRQYASQTLVYLRICVTKESRPTKHQVLYNISRKSGGYSIKCGNRSILNIE